VTAFDRRYWLDWFTLDEIRVMAGDLARERHNFCT